MKIQLHFLLALLLTAGVARAQERELLQDRIALGQAGMEIQTRGPVHEAFAGTMSYDAEPGLVVPGSPPNVIQEVTPDQRPAGQDTAWIPGYWAWDDDRNDFLWVSGIWRTLPPDRQWVPGYWRTDGERSRWTTGFWADAQAQEIEYLPEPPASVEDGPQGEATSADHVWIPGVWLWRDSQYLWRPGFWAQGHQNWDWIPDHYVWSPRGYVFVNGYYDYPVDQRGVLFAPVYFTSRDYAREDFTYSPSVAISTAALARHLFVRPNYGHYYFGDYYDSRYATRGLTSWSNYHIGRTGYDPFYTRQRWNNRGNVGWAQTVQTNYQTLQNDATRRPARTWTEQQTRMNQRDAAVDLNYQIGEAYDTFARGNVVGDGVARDGIVGDRSNRDGIALDAVNRENIAREGDRARRRFQAVESTERQQYVERQRALQRSRDERQKLEQATVEADADATTPGTRRPGDFTRSRTPLPSSSIKGRPSDRLDKELAPPARQRGPEPDPKVEPRRRAARVDLDGDTIRGPGRPGDEGARPRSNRPGQPRTDAAPEGTRPGSARPGSPARPGAGRPDAVRPGEGRPGAGRPEAGRPGAGRPGPAQPGAAKPEADKPAPMKSEGSPATPPQAAPKDKPMGTPPQADSPAKPEKPPKEKPE